MEPQAIPTPGFLTRREQLLPLPQFPVDCREAGGQHPDGCKYLQALVHSTGSMWPRQWKDSGFDNNTQSGMLDLCLRFYLGGRPKRTWVWSGLLGRTAGQAWATWPRYKYPVISSTLYVTKSQSHPYYSA